jgi:hypothetical protein
MIYLIDDKKERQKNLGWDEVKLNAYIDILKPIYTSGQIEAERVNIFSADNIVLYHESFFDNPDNHHKKKSTEIKQDLIYFSEQNKFIVVFFSGSIGSKKIDNNTASIPVSTLYKNLKFFLNAYNNSNQEININQIAYGNDFKNEKMLEIKRKIWNLLFEKDNSSLFVNTGQLNLELDQIQKLTTSTLNLKDVTVEFLKFQINKILVINE